MTQRCLISQMHAGNDGLLSNCKQQSEDECRQREHWKQHHPHTSKYKEAY